MISVVNFIPSKFGSFPQVFWKVVLHTRLNGYRESSGDSWFVTNNLLVYDTWSEARSISCTSSIFPLNLISVWPIPSQNNIHCWWIEIKKIPKYKLYDKIGDLSKTTFWYHNNDTKKNPWVIFFSHWPINDSSGCLPFTLQLSYKLLGILQCVNKSRKANISSHDGMQNFLTSIFLTIGPRVSKSGDRVTEICSFHIKY